jgi:nitrate/nitrite transport system ATP-binding protein
VEAQKIIGPAGENGVRLPDVVPITSTDFVPKAVRAASKIRPLSNQDKYVEFYNVHKVFPTPRGPLTVVEGFNLDIRRGECVSLIGHSGCGKSTALSMCAGLTGISDGGIALDGREITNAGPDRGVVFQAPTLFNWLTARQNVALGVERVYPHATRAERRDIVDYYLTRVGLGDSLDRPARDMSNGMRQRVGLARAFALSPKLLLLDEPFGMLDALTRWDLQEVLMDVLRRTRITAICVTHDVDEAILVADRVIMMTNGPRARIGKVMQVDLPRPRTRKMLLEHPRYYAYREELLSFLEEYEHGEGSRAA